MPEERFAQSAVLAPISFNAVSSDAQSYSFAMVGDTHIAAADTRRLRQILQIAESEGDAFLIVLGDIVDEGRREDFLAYTKAIKDAGWEGKVISVIGNHDIKYDGWKNYSELIGPTHYSVDFGNARFMIIDTADGSVGAQQMGWLKERLSEARPRHTFVLTHYMPVVPDERTHLKLASISEAMSLMRLLSTSHVRGCFGGHYHSYIVAQTEGVDYVVAGGAAGRRLPPVMTNFFVQVTVIGDSVSYLRQDLGVPSL